MRRLDLVVISHSDADHLGGLPTLLQAVRVDRVVHNGRSVDTDLYSQTRRLLRRNGVSRQAAHRGDTLQMDSSIRAEVLSPPRRSTLATENNASVGRIFKVS
ncbi:MBL fold metallo-hydrolase [Salinibacter ruber]|uniref:MBL fold metallo-hydrolase n=1 Tax=Salinibacter ruber TaxID=146919 RepID=UPI00311AB200